MMNHIRDPYMSDEDFEEYEHLEAERWPEPMTWKFFGTLLAACIAISAVAAIAGGIMGALSDADFPLALMSGFTVGGLSLAYVSVFTLSDLRDERRYNELKGSFVEAHYDAKHAMQRLSTALRNLPMEARLNFKSLWLAALDVNALLVETEGEEGDVGRIVARAEAVEDYLAAHRAMLAEEEAARRANAREAALNVHGSTDDSDLELISIYTEALEEGKRRYRELSESGRELA